MSNYTPTGAPADQTRGASATIRSEFQTVATAIATKSDTAGETYSGTHDFTGATLIAPGKADVAGETYSGTHDFSGATVVVATQASSDSSTNPASTAFVQNAVSPIAGSSATSASSLTIGTGAKSLTIQTGKAFSVGQTVVMVSAANVANQMMGQITAHNSGTGSLTVNVSAIGGSGTLADWIISLSALNPGVSVTWGGKQTFTGYQDTVYAITDGAAFAIDPANGAIQTVTLGASRTPVLANFSEGQTVVLGINDGTAYAITWTSIAPTWVRPGGTGAAPTLHTTGYTWVLLWKVGSTVYASEIGKP